MSERIVAQKGPYGIDVEPGKKYWWCACGRSQKQPFCDGSHKGTGLSPLPFTATEGERLWFCGCKRTGREPFCDGTHERL
jgi:CDGSH-type Zn-finger protein